MILILKRSQNLGFTIECKRKFGILRLPCHQWSLPLAGEEEMMDNGGGAPSAPLWVALPLVLGRSRWNEECDKRSLNDHPRFILSLCGIYPSLILRQVRYIVVWRALVYGLHTLESRRVLPRCLVDCRDVLVPKKLWASFDCLALTPYMSGRSYCLGLPSLGVASRVFLMSRKAGLRADMQA